VLYNVSGELRLSPSVVRSVPNANVFKSGSVMLITDNSPINPNRSNVWVLCCCRFFRCEFSKKACSISRANRAFIAGSGCCCTEAKYGADIIAGGLLNIRWLRLLKRISSSLSSIVGLFVVFCDAFLNPGSAGKSSFPKLNSCWCSTKSYVKFKELHGGIR